MEPRGEKEALPLQVSQRCCGCKCVILFLVKYHLYIELCGRACGWGFWQRFHQYDVTCQYPALPANQSGVKVMLAGFAKMGTRTMSRTLYELGYERSYHGEEYLQHVWHPIATEYWAQPEHGGFVVPPIGSLSDITEHDLEVLNNTAPELLAARTSSCRTDAVALDGAERLFWPIMQVSPEAKVIVLDWRTYYESKRSMEAFMALFVPWIVATGNLAAGLNLLPWPLLFCASEPLFGWPIKRLLESGGPPLNQVQSPYVMFWQKHTAQLRYSGHWAMGLADWASSSKSNHDAFFERVRREVPSERRLHVNPSKTTYEDLCRFLELEPCKRSGRIPRAINLGNHEIDFLPAFAMLTPVWILVHWVNWRLGHWLCWRVWRGLLTVLPGRSSAERHCS